MRIIKSILPFVLLVAIGCGSNPITITFDNLSQVTWAGAPVKVGDQIPAGDLITVTNGTTTAELIVLPFYEGSALHEFGFVTIVPAPNQAGGSGNALRFNNASLGFKGAGQGRPVKKIEAKYGFMGGEVNLIVGSDLLAGWGLDKINKSAIPKDVKLDLTVLKQDQSTQLGELRLSGKLGIVQYEFKGSKKTYPKEFSAAVGGGQELYIDDLKLTL